MIDNNEQLLVVVYWEDIPQFELFCYSIDRFWKGKQNIKIVVSTKVKKEEFKDITRINRQQIKKIIDDITNKYLKKWNFEIVIREEATWSDGWTEQQIFKVIESNRSRNENIIVFDCKDVLVKDMCYNDFVDENKNYLIKIRDGQVKDLSDHSSYSYWNVETDQYVFPSNLTPWIWNQKDLQDYIFEIQKKEKTRFIDIEFFPGNYEIENYFVYISFVKHNPSKKYQLVEQYGYSGNLFFYPDIKVKNINLDKTDFKLLKIHRRLVHNENFKKEIFLGLFRLNFPIELIEKWKKTSSEYLENWKTFDDNCIFKYSDRNK